MAEALRRALKVSKDVYRGYIPNELPQHLPNKMKWWWKVQGKPRVTLYTRPVEDNGVTNEPQYSSLNDTSFDGFHRKVRTDRYESSTTLPTAEQTLWNKDRYATHYIAHINNFLPCFNSLPMAQYKIQTHMIDSSPAYYHSSSSMNNTNMDSSDNKQENKHRRDTRTFEEANEKTFNVPNVLTMTRMAMTPAIGYFIWEGMLMHGLACFTFAAITDLLDGFIARKFNQQTYVGATLDPIADKFLLVTCFIALYNAGIAPLWFVKGSILRDIILISGYTVIRYMGLGEKPTLRMFFDFKNRPTLGLEPTLLGKINTSLQCLVVAVHLSTNSLAGLPMYDWSIFGLHTITAITTVASLSQYIQKAMQPSFFAKPSYKFKQ